MIARPAYAAADTAALRHADFRDFTAMVRGSAKLRDRILIARGLEPIGMPHINDNVKRGNGRRVAIKADLPERACTGCGAAISSRKNKTGFCMTCHVAARRHSAKRCDVCDTVLTRKNRSGRCAEHRRKLRAAHPNDVVRQMIAKVAHVLGVTEGDILGQGHQRRLVEARSVIALALRRRGYSLPQIGHRLGREHTSIGNILDNFTVYAARNPKVAEALEALA